MASISDHGDLFIQPPGFEKEAGTKMPPDTELWSEAVFSVFSEAWPDLADLSSGDVDWDESKIDEEFGFGIGTIVINSGNAIVKVPIIVKEYRLQPIDIFEADGKMQLLNEENIGAALKEQDSIGEVSYPRRMDFKSTKIVDWLTKGATAVGWNKRVKEYSKLAKRVGGPYVDPLLQHFQDAPVSGPDKSASVVYFEKSGNLGELRMVSYRNGEVVQMGPASFDDPSIYRNETLKEASTLAFQNGYSICPIEEIKKAEVGFIGIDMTEGLGLINEPGVYSGQAIADEGVENVPVFAMNIIPFDSSEVPENPKMAFVVQGDNQLNYAQQDSAVGKPKPSSGFNFSESMVPLSDVDRYDKGFILFDDGDSIQTSSGLVTIDRMEQTMLGSIRIFMHTPEGGVRYLLDESFNKILTLADADKLYSPKYDLNLTGPNLKFLKVNDQVELVSSLDKHQMIADDAVVKAAKDTASMSVRYLKDIDKVAAKFGRDNYEDPPTRFVARMMSLGVPPENTALLITHVKESSVPIQVVGLLQEKAAELKLSPADTLSLMSDLNGMREFIIKAASAIEAGGAGGEQAAAAVLGVGMIAEENLRYFLQEIPILEDVTNVLSRMLYSARIGDIQLDEGAIKSALVNVTKIIGKLKKISARL